MTPLAQNILKTLRAEIQADIAAVKAAEIAWAAARQKYLATQLKYAATLKGSAK